MIDALRISLFRGYMCVRGQHLRAKYEYMWVLSGNRRGRTKAHYRDDERPSEGELFDDRVGSVR